jgi:hypothetical protein
LIPPHERVFGDHFLGTDINDGGVSSLLSTTSLPFRMNGHGGQGQGGFEGEQCVEIFCLFFRKITDQLGSLKVCENEDDVTKGLLNSPSQMPLQKVRLANKVLGKSIYVFGYASLALFTSTFFQP